MYFCALIVPRETTRNEAISRFSRPSLPATQRCSDVTRTLNMRLLRCSVVRKRLLTGGYTPTWLATNHTPPNRCILVLVSSLRTCLMRLKPIGKRAGTAGRHYSQTHTHTHDQVFSQRLTVYQKGSLRRVLASPFRYTSDTHPSLKVLFNSRSHYKKCAE
jgi:hypothetical protein